MAEYPHRGHSVADRKHHRIRVTKDRFAVLKGDVAIRCRDLRRQTCQAREVNSVRGAVSPGPVHLLVSAPPLLAPAKRVQSLKGSRSRRRQEEVPGGAKTRRGQQQWARGSCGATVGAVDEKPSNAASKSQSGTTTAEDNRLLS